MVRKFSIVSFLLLTMASLGLTHTALAATTQLSPGVVLDKKEGSATGIQHMQIQLNNPYTQVQLGLPKYRQLVPTSTQATRDSTESRKVVGAMNGSFFHFENKEPIYLVVQNGEIYNSGIIPKSRDGYVSSRFAFGVTESGQPLIAPYQESYTGEVNQQKFKINGVNRQRSADETILYTPQFFDTNTRTNQFGIEYLIETNQEIKSTAFGSTYTGKIVEVRGYGDPKPFNIGKTQLVLSFTSSASERVALKLDDQVSFQLDIDSPWKNAQFMIGSGPQLVMNGRVDIGMNPSSSTARTVAARSAVAVKYKTNEVHFVTVDRVNGRGGMNLPDFAKYLQGQGYDAAMNLDGGGSTTMSYRPYTSATLTKSNQPTYGSERAVSAILEAVSTAPTQSTAKKISYQIPNRSKTFLVGTSIQPTVDYAVDEFLNPLPVNKVTFKPTKNKIYNKGNLLITQQAGLEEVHVQYNGNTVEQFNLNIVHSPTELLLKAQSTTSKINSKIPLSIQMLDDNGKEIIYSKTALKWSISPEVGKIEGGQWIVAGQPGAKGKITLTVGEKHVSLPVEIEGEKVISVADRYLDIPPTYSYLKELQFLNDRGIMFGYGKYFKPQQSLSRQQAVMILSRAMSLDLSKEYVQQFKDVPKTHPAYQEIHAAYAAGVISGKSSDHFDSQSNVTRSEVAKILVNAFNLQGKTDQKFIDVNDTNWSAPFIYRLVGSGVANGYSDGTFKGSDPVQRIHFGKMIVESLQR